MMDQPSTETADPSERPGIGELVAQLRDDVTGFVQAKVAVYRAQAGEKAQSAGIIAALFSGALVLALAAVIALLVGLIIGLAPLVGIWWALSVVVTAALALAAILAKVGAARVGKLMNSKGNE